MSLGRRGCGIHVVSLVTPPGGGRSCEGNLITVVTPFPGVTIPLVSAGPAASTPRHCWWHGLGCCGGATHQPDHARSRRHTPCPDLLRTPRLARPGSRGDRLLPGRGHGPDPVGARKARRRQWRQRQWRQRQWRQRQWRKGRGRQGRGRHHRRLRRRRPGAQRQVTGRGRRGAGRGGRRGRRDNAARQGDLLRRLRRLFPRPRRPRLGDRLEPQLHPGP